METTIADEIYTDCPSVTKAVRRHDAEPKPKQEWNLVAPSHGQIRKSVKLSIAHCSVKIRRPNVKSTDQEKGSLVLA